MGCSWSENVRQSNQIEIYLTNIVIGQKSTNQIAQYMVKSWHSFRTLLLTSGTSGRPLGDFQRVCRKWHSYNAKISRRIQIFVLQGLGRYGPSILGKPAWNLSHSVSQPWWVITEFQSHLGFGSCLAFCKICLLHIHVKKTRALASRNCITNVLLWCRSVKTSQIFTGFGSCLAFCKICLLHIHGKKTRALASRNCITNVLLWCRSVKTSQISAHELN